MNEKNGNMYKAAVKTWSPFKGCGYDCSYCKGSFQAQAKRQKQNCMRCYDYVPHEHPERLEQTLPGTAYGQFIFACSSGDIAFCETPYLERIIERIRRDKERTFLLQTKNPATFNRVKWPRNVILGITLETNRDSLALAVSKAPTPSQRMRDFLAVDHPVKMVTIEPIMDFDLPIMLEWIDAIAPALVWMGYDSKKTCLVEPSMEKFREFHWELTTRKYMVALKTVRYAKGQEKSVKEAVQPAVAPVSMKEWSLKLGEKWAAIAKPHVRRAITALAVSSVPMTTAELNLLGGGHSGGAITGGLNAWATRNGLPMPLVKVKSGGKKGYRFVSEDLREMFVVALEAGDGQDEQTRQEMN